MANEESQPLSPEEHAAIQAAYSERPTVCSLCAQQFDNAEGYRQHVCPANGFAPTDPRHLGEDFPAVSEAAQQRGSEAGPVQG